MAAKSAVRIAYKTAHSGSGIAIIIPVYVVAISLAM
jgi:hypothetical protein